MKRILVAVACLLPFGARRRGRHQPKFSRGGRQGRICGGSRRLFRAAAPGVMDDNTLRAHFFSRSLLRSIAAERVSPAGARRAGRAAPRPLQR